jgi:hypothetical protein
VYGRLTPNRSANSPRLTPPRSYACRILHRKSSEYARAMPMLSPENSPTAAYDTFHIQAYTFQGTALVRVASVFTVGLAGTGARTVLRRTRGMLPRLAARLLA